MKTPTRPMHAGPSPPTEGGGPRKTAILRDLVSLARRIAALSLLTARVTMTGLVTLTVLAALPALAPAQNVSVTDYSVPVSRADNLRISALNLNYTSEGDSAVFQAGNVAVVYKKFYESLPFAYSIDFIGSTSFRKDNLQDKWTGDLNTSLVTRVKKYTRAKGRFFFFGDTDWDFRDSFDRPATNMTLGIGFGRFINATPLRKAVRIEDFLLEEGIVAEHLPKETMIELGHKIEREREYKDRHGDRYQNYWFEDMSNEITKSGLVLGDIGFGILRMREVLFQEQINDRFYGWDATAGVRFEVQTSTEGQARRTPAMSLRFRYSRPISWSTQINTDFQVNSPFSGDFARIYSLKQTTDFIYEFTNKINFTATHIFRADKQPLLVQADEPPPEQPDTPVFETDAKLSTVIDIGLVLFVENKFNLSASERIITGEGALRQSFQIGLSYRIF